MKTFKFRFRVCSIRFVALAGAILHSEFSESSFRPSSSCSWSLIKITSLEMIISLNLRLTRHSQSPTARVIWASSSQVVRRVDHPVSSCLTISAAAASFTHSFIHLLSFYPLKTYSVRHSCRHRENSRRKGTTNVLMSVISNRGRL